MLRGIRAPGPPPLGAGEQLAGVLPPPLCIDHRAYQADVGGGKGIGLAQLAHGDVPGVHSPTPSIARSWRIASSRLRRGPNICSSVTTARANTLER
jgi:hypothetical protein